MRRGRREVGGGRELGECEGEKRWNWVEGGWGEGGEGGGGG